MSRRAARLGSDLLFAFSVAAALFLGVGAAENAKSRSDPKLVVLIAVDQFRRDYVAWYGANWTGGLHRLFTKGAYFEKAAYPYASTVTCVGHTTIGTGAFPHTHGMIGNVFFDRTLARRESCTYDPDARAILAGGGLSSEHQGPHYLMTTSFADELRRQAGVAPRIVAVSLKADAVIGLIGHGGPGTIAIWRDGSGAWATSTAYATTMWPEVEAYQSAHPPSSEFPRTWTRLLPDTAYRFDDDARGEPAPRTFPHSIDTWQAWPRSPFSDEYLADMAASLAEKLSMGTRDATDMIAISFSALDLVGHAYGPRSHEVQDVLARLDVTLGHLFDRLDARVGANHYVVALSADHGVATIPEQITDTEAGRVSSTDLARRIDAALAQTVGEDAHALPGAELSFNFSEAVAARLHSSEDARRAVKTAVLATPGVSEMFWSDEISAATPPSDALLAALRLSYVPGRSGDLVVGLKPNWVAAGGTTGTTHGTFNTYDREVPVVFYGAGVVPGVYRDDASPADIAPTLAYLTGVTLAHADGHARTDAVKR